MMREIGSIHCTDTFQSTYFIRESGLLLTLYIDDMVVSGPENQHKSFWEKVQKQIEIEEPSPVDRILGRHHKISRDKHGSTMQYDMTDFAENACKAYEELSGCTLKKAATPYLPEGSLVDSDFEDRGQMAENASRVLVKILWSARLARPDLMKGISDLTRRITTIYIFTPSHLQISSRSSFYSLLRRGPRNATLSHEMDVGRQNLTKNCDLTWPIATLSHEIDVGRQKLTKKCDSS